MKDKKDMSESDILRGRLIILEYMIDELINMHQDKDNHPIDRVASMQLAVDLEQLRHMKFDVAWRLGQAKRMHALSTGLED
jgi:hypothetical protein